MEKTPVEEKGWGWLGGPCCQPPQPNHFSLSSKTTKVPPERDFRHTRLLEETLLDEQHLLVLRQWPEVVGDDALELVGHRADVVHRGDDLVAHVLGPLEGLVVGLVLGEVDLLELADRLPERVEQSVGL